MLWGLEQGAPRDCIGGAGREGARRGRNGRPATLEGMACGAEAGHVPVHTLER